MDLELVALHFPVKSSDATMSETFQSYHGVPNIFFTGVGASAVSNTNAIPCQNKSPSLSNYCEILIHIQY